MSKIISIGKITREHRIKAIKIANREIEITNGKKTFHTVVKNKKRDADRKSCRQWKNSGLAY